MPRLRYDISIFPIVCMLFHDYMSVTSVGESFVMGYGQYGTSIFCLPAEEREYFFRNRSRERKSVHRQWSVVCQSLRLRLSSSVGVGLRIFRSPVCNITLVPDPNPRNMQINGFQKRVYPGLPLNRRAIVPCPLPIPAAMPVLVESMQSAYGQRRRFLYPAECRSRRCVLLLTE